MKESINQRIKEIIKYYNISDYSFAKKVKVGQKTISNMFIRGTEPSSKTISSILNNLDEINKEWLLTGYGEMIKRKDSINKESGLPLFPYNAMAGILTGTGNSAMEYECERFVIPTFHDADFLVRVQGDSMEPKYFSGDIVACKKVCLDKLWFQWGKTYVIGTSQGTLIKTLKEGNIENNVTVISNNDNYPPFQLPIDEIINNGIALVIGLIRIE